MFSLGHMVIFSTKPEEDRALMAKLMPKPGVDVGGGWMIYPMPPSEIAIHPSDSAVHHEIHFHVKDIGVARATLAELGLDSPEPQDLGYGLVSSFTLPGGSTVGFYQPAFQGPV